MEKNCQSFRQGGNGGKGQLGCNFKSNWGTWERQDHNYQLVGGCGSRLLVLERRDQKGINQSDPAEDSRCGKRAIRRWGGSQFSSSIRRSARVCTTRKNGGGGNN